MEKKSNHQANIVRVTELLPHNNADTLEIIRIGDYQVVSKKGQFKPGDLAVYIQPDSVVPQTEPFRFIWGPYAIVPPTFTDAVSERKRRITVRKFRGEWSEGLLLPLFDFGLIGCHAYKAETPEEVNEGDDVSDLLGITHYDPDSGVESTKGNNSGGPRRQLRYPRTFKGWFFFLLRKLGFRGGLSLNEDVSFDLPVYDVDALKNYRNVLQPGEAVVVSEKIHGSNARYVFVDGKMYAGSHNFWKAPNSNCVWRKALKQNPWIEQWCRAHEGYGLYGEVTPTQKGFNYGCKEGEIKFFVFDIRQPDGTWMNWKAHWPETYEMVIDLNIVPIIYTGPFDLDKIKSLTDGPSQVPDAKHMREGVVVKPQEERRVPGLGRVILKLVSNSFLEKDSR